MRHIDVYSMFFHWLLWNVSAKIINRREYFGCIDSESTLVVNMAQRLKYVVFIVDYERQIWRRYHDTTLMPAIWRQFDVLIWLLLFYGLFCDMETIMT